MGSPFVVEMPHLGTIVLLHLLGDGAQLHRAQLARHRADRHDACALDPIDCRRQEAAGSKCGMIARVLVVDGRD